MKKDFGKNPWFYPLPVLIVGTYDKNGNADAMNAAWGGLYGADNGRCILTPGSCELYSIQRIDVGKFKSCSVLFPDGAGTSLCTRVDLHGDCNYSEK